MAISKAQVKHDEEMLGSVWDWVKSAKAEYGYPIRLQLLMTERRGVFIIKAQALKMDGDKAVGFAHQYEVEWPRSQHATLAGALLGACITLEHQLCIELAPEHEPDK